MAVTSLKMVETPRLCPSGHFLGGFGGVRFLAFFSPVQYFFQKLVFSIFVNVNLIDSVFLKRHKNISRMTNIPISYFNWSWGQTRKSQEKLGTYVKNYQKYEWLSMGGGLLWPPPREIGLKNNTNIYNWGHKKKCRYNFWTSLPELTKHV